NRKRGIMGSLRRQITIPFVLLIIFAVGIVAVVSYTSSVRITTNELSNSVNSQIASVNDTFNLYFTNMENYLTRLGNDSTVRHYEGGNSNSVYISLQETTDTESHISAA